MYILYYISAALYYIGARKYGEYFLNYAILYNANNNIVHVWVGGCECVYNS